MMRVINSIINAHGEYRLSDEKEINKVLQDGWNLIDVKSTAFGPDNGEYPKILTTYILEKKDKQELSPDKRAAIAAAEQLSKFHTFETAETSANRYFDDDYQSFVKNLQTGENS